MSNVIGQPLDRVDGRLKVTGGARYAAEIPITGVAYGVLIQSSIAKGRIGNIDTTIASRAPGVISIITHLNAPRLARPTQMPHGQSHPILQGPEIYYSGQSIGIVVADTLERAEHAATLVRVTYDEVKPNVIMEDHLSEAYKPPMGIVGGKSADSLRGDIDQGLGGATTRVEQTYITPIHHHNAMEPHATLAVWEGENLVAYNATQNVYGSRQALAEGLGVALENVRVINPFVGGGFGSKGMTWPHTIITAMAARELKRPVKLSLTREQMFFSNGHRPHTIQKVTLGASADGKLTAIRHETTSHTSTQDDFVEPSGVLTQMLYSCPNVQVTHRLVRLDVGTPTFTRAPGEASGSFAVESAMDELAYALKIDPVELRLRNYAEQDEQEKKPFSSKSLRECYQTGAEKFGWSQRTFEPRSMRDGRYLIGMGMATATYPANFRPASAKAIMFADGRALAQSATHDLGTGGFTVMTQIAADALTLPPDRVRFELGDTRFPEAPGAGGSASAASAGSAVQAACMALKTRLIQMSLSDKSSPLSGLNPQQVSVENGRMFAKDNPSRGETFAQLLTRRNEPRIEAQASAQPGKERGGGGGGSSQGQGSEQADKGGDKGYSMHSFGAHFVEVRVDPDLGIIRVSRALGVYGAGKILNAKTAHSQMIGGMTMGIGMALLEATHIDANFGRFSNSNLAEYLVPVNADIPNLDVHFIDEKDQFVNPIGVKGIGEIGIVGVAAAVANAVFHATGKRVRDLPVTLDKLL